MATLVVISKTWDYKKDKIPNKIEDVYDVLKRSWSYAHDSKDPLNRVVSDKWGTGHQTRELDEYDEPVYQRPGTDYDLYLSASAAIGM